MKLKFEHETLGMKLTKTKHRDQDKETTHCLKGNQMLKRVLRLRKNNQELKDLNTPVPLSRGPSHSHMLKQRDWRLIQQQGM